MPDVNSEINAIAVREKSVDEALVAFQEKYPEAFKVMKQIEDAQAQIKKLKEAVKEKLLADRDFDLHEVGDLKVSLSGVAKVKVVDIDKVPDEFKEVKTVVKEKKAQEYLKIMGRCPEGLEDATYYRLNWKIKK